VRVEGAGEGAIAEPLAVLARANPELSLGSYPFYGPQGYGSNLVVRGRDGEAVERIVTELIEALADVGANAITRVEA
jgi:molybdopterin-biosynthesis enzyme MoeA-like protein